MRPDFSTSSLFRFCCVAALAALLTACRSTRQPETPAGAHFRLLTYNINWGEPGPDLAAEIIRQSGADIVCLQETTPHWERTLRGALSEDYPFMEFRESKGRMGGGLAFLSKLPGQEAAYTRSETGWFDGWIMAFDTPAGQVQVLNVHLHPPVGKNGSWNLSGYLCTGTERLKEMQRFYPARRPNVPTLVVGDFNDVETCSTIKWLNQQGMTNALPEFDRHSPTWHWKWGLISLHRRMDHILYSPELHCCSAEVQRAGASDHFPVAATFEKSHSR